MIRQRHLCGIALFIEDSFRPRLICLLFSTFSPFLLRMTRLTSVCHCVEFPSILHSLFTILALTAFLFPFICIWRGWHPSAVFLCHDITVKLSIWPMLDARGGDGVYKVSAGKQNYIHPFLLIQNTIKWIGTKVSLPPPSHLKSGKSNLLVLPDMRHILKYFSFWFKPAMGHCIYRWL